jgi:hypothetical protein
MLEAALRQWMPNASINFQPTLMINPSLIHGTMFLAFCWNMPVCQLEERTVRRLPAGVGCHLFEC